MKRNINHEEFTHPRLVSIYDTINTVESYKDFYIETIATLGSKNIIDFGCGTGLLTCELIVPDCTIIGIDPSSALIGKAIERDTNNNITWKIGCDFDAIESDSIDIIVLSGHVVQFLTERSTWESFLGGSARILKKGGYLLFESRNPDIIPFQNWPTQNTPAFFGESPEGSFSWWWKKGDWKENILSYSLFYHFDTPDTITESPMSLIFRAKDEIIHDASIYGFNLENIYGDWKKSPFSKDSEEMIFLFKKS